MNKVLAVSIAFALVLCNGEFIQQASAAEAYQPKTQRGQLVRKIVKQWGPYVQEAYKANLSSWAKEMGPLFAKASLNDLQKAADARNFDTMNNALLGASVAAKGGAITPKTLGEIAADLVFVPIPPCRILDTRLAVGAIAAGTTRGVDVSAVSDYSFQGGDASNCSGMGAAGSFAAVAVNFTSVTPAQTGYFTAFPFLGTQPLAATQVYTAGGILSNFAIVRLDQGASANEMNIYSERQLHLVADVVGYYINPQATALDCVDTADTVVSVAAGATANAVAPACTATYTQTATNCESSTWQMPFVFFSGGVCSAQNNSAGNASLRASRTCCRVPGR
ncbi:hypothetical protein [Pseudoxanthomonas sacheonensis]|uniref:hypothetical protein n=1 Tax=Pseudoxanthomonas sacheonensis TaxID=443615 RepID=UPI0013D5E637|nr:hypothetical protein [Pseudoxanthomonas sacheonensis]KAF1707604.1 hypothetical protein CSC73_11505 [Pseudoxanthomonas sacheonensis]